MKNIPVNIPKIIVAETNLIRLNSFQVDGEVIEDKIKFYYLGSQITKMIGQKIQKARQVYGYGMLNSVWKAANKTNKTANIEVMLSISAALLCSCEILKLARTIISTLYSSFR